MANEDEELSDMEKAANRIDEEESDEEQN